MMPERGRTEGVGLPGEIHQREQRERVQEEKGEGKSQKGNGFDTHMYYPHLGFFLGEIPILPFFYLGFYILPSLKKFYPRNLEYDKSTNQKRKNRNALLFKMSLTHLSSLSLSSTRITSCTRNTL